VENKIYKFEFEIFITDDEDEGVLFKMTFQRRVRNHDEERKVLINPNHIQKGIADKA